jgi:hypothetical protein
MDSQRDITDIIERLDVFEERAGVSLEALYCSIEGPYMDGTYHIELNGEMHANAGTQIDVDISLICSVYDAKGRVIETHNDYIGQDSFFGFHTFSFSVITGTGDPARIRVYPNVI